MWKFQENLTLNLIEHPGYQIDLDRCNSSAQVLDWIVQVSKKNWATDEVVGSLVKELDQALHIQGNLCPCGTDKPFDAKMWLESRKGREHRYLTEKVLQKYLKKSSEDHGFFSMKDLMGATLDALKNMPQ